MTKLHAGGKFELQELQGLGWFARRRGERRQCALGKAGVGNLAEGYTWQQEYSCGAPKAPLAKAGKAGRKTGTRVTFKPDVTIMEAHGIQLRHAGATAARVGVPEQGLKITLADERVDPEKKTEFLYTGGISEFIRHLNRGKDRAARQTDPLRGGPGAAQQWDAHHGSGSAVQRWILGERFPASRTISTPGWGNAPERIPLRAHRTINAFASRLGCSKM